jgi:hypothetical protein
MMHCLEKEAMALFADAGGYQPMQAEIHEQFRFLKVCPELGVVSPDHLAKAYHHPMAYRLPSDCDANKSDLSLIEIGANNSNALSDHIGNWAEVLFHDWLEARARGLEFLQPKACFVVLERTSGRFVWNRFLVHQVDLFPQESNSPLTVTRNPVS